MAIGTIKARYVYTDDSGSNWLVDISEDNGGTAGNGLTVYNPASPPTPAPVGKISPKKCRRVYADGTTGTAPNLRIIRRYFVCNASATLYKSNAPQSVAYPGATGSSLTTTGRRGEKITF